MIRKNKRRFDPRYFMDEKTDKKVIKEAEFRYDAPFKTGIPDELASAATAMDFEKYPVTPEEQAGEDMAEFLEQMFVEEGGDKSWLGNYDFEILQMAQALRDSNITPADFPEMADDPLVSQIRIRILEMADESANLDQFGNPTYRYEDEEEDYEDEEEYLREVKPGVASMGGFSGGSGRVDDITLLTRRLDKMERALTEIRDSATLAVGAAPPEQTEND
jgi:hypothetical protein